MQQIIGDLQDYKRGALGNVLELESQHLEYLRIAECEMQAWENENHRQVASSSKE